MKTNRTYVLTSLVTILAVSSMSFGIVGFAQTVPTLSCSAGSSSVVVNQTNTMSALGGTGAYTWSGQNLSVTNSAGSQFLVSYSTPGVYTITVTSGSQSATCNTTVVPLATNGSLSCSPAAQNVTIGQSIVASANGGDGSYLWSSPDLNITSANGSSFNATFGSVGVKTLTATSAGLSASCQITVLAGGTTPGLPNTGGGYQE